MSRFGNPIASIYAREKACLFVGWLLLTTYQHTNNLFPSRIWEVPQWPELPRRDLAQEEGTMISESKVTVGCPGFATAGASRCAGHLRVNKYPGIYTRPSAHKRGYDRTWQRLRLLKLSLNPVCENGDNSPAVEVDHVIPLRLGGSNRLSNLRSLCKSCHSRKTRVVDMQKIKAHELAAGRGE